MAEPVESHEAATFIRIGSGKFNKLGVIVARRRGFFAEIQHQNKLAEQRQRAAQRERDARARRAEQAQKAIVREAERAEKAAAAAVRATEAERKRLQREAVAARTAAMNGEAESRNATLVEYYQELDGLLQATLDIDDYVDLERFRVRAEHPPFAYPQLKLPILRPEPIEEPPAPVRAEAEKPTGLFGRKKKWEEANAAADSRFEEELSAWKRSIAQIPARQKERDAEHSKLERERLLALGKETARYEQECRARDEAVASKNAALDELITGLSYGTVDAVQEYVGIVLASSVYPESFPVSHEAEFVPETAELKLTVLIPAPTEVLSVKHYRYVKANDEITATALSQKDTKERYLSLVQSVTLRTLHEVFEADRRGLIRSISLELGANAVNPATGRPQTVLFAAVAAERAVFEEIDLSEIVPAATLDHLGAVVSKNPNGLVEISSGGVRRG